MVVPRYQTVPDSLPEFHLRVQNKRQCRFHRGWNHCSPHPSSPSAAPMEMRPGANATCIAWIAVATPFAFIAAHLDTRIIKSFRQIRRSSYHDVVRVAEIQKVLDISGVQTYVINSARVLFLNERPQPKTGKGVSHICETCGRSLLDPFRFCSLGCKLVGIKRNGDASFSLEAKNEMAMERGEGISRRESSRDEDELREGLQQDIYPPTPPPPPSSARRRKGIPHRAPFAS
uniref:PLATZ transcription factor family protein n=1 Tax=Vitis vinifera TaxID=29760 RepID=F6HKE1_VITVI